MSNFSHGHSDVFWSLVIQSIEDAETLGPEDRKIYLISPWMRDLDLTTSGLPTEDWREILDAYEGPLSRLSDVLVAMKKKLNYQIIVLTLDSADKLLPKTDRFWLGQEHTMVQRLVGSSNDNPIITVQKKSGVHTKKYVFPSAVLHGSVNLTNAGMFLNGENLNLTRKDQDGYGQIVINAAASIAGSAPYFEHTGDYWKPEFGDLISDSADLSDSPIPELENSEYKHPDPQKTPEAYAHAPNSALGGIPNTGSKFITEKELIALFLWTRQFEIELRSLIQTYYGNFAGNMVTWVELLEQGDIESNDIGNHLKENWHHHLQVQHPGGIMSFHDSAGKRLTQTNQNTKPGDFEEGELPSLENLTPSLALRYGTALKDLWMCIFGNTNKPLHDYGGTYLMDESLKLFTFNALGLIPSSSRVSNRNKESNESDVQKFWIKLEDAFDAIYWIRNKGLAHPNEIPRERAIACQTGLKLFHQRVLDPFAIYIGSSE